MKIFLDSADVDAITSRFATGLVDGVTTNPTLIRKSGKDPHDVYRELVKLGVTDISMEVVGNAEEMYHEAMLLHTEYKEVCTVKLPCTKEGLKVCRKLSDIGIRTNVTLIFSAAQAILAAKAGATISLLSSGDMMTISPESRISSFYHYNLSSPRCADSSSSCIIERCI